MKFTRAEKIWLAAVIIFYACYNLPFVPSYGHARATLVHGLITLIPLWIAVYIGLIKICKIYRLRDPQKTGADSAADENRRCRTDSEAAAAETFASYTDSQSGRPADDLKQSPSSQTKPGKEDSSC